MAGKSFDPHGSDPETRLARLPNADRLALEGLAERMARLRALARGHSKDDITENRSWRHFLLPLAEFGYSPRQLAGLAEALPTAWNPDHAEVWWDFRLCRWQRHLEPPTLEQVFEDCFVDAPEPEEVYREIRARLEAIRSRYRI